MNNERREQIAKAIELLNEAQGLIESAKDEEQEYFDNMPESFQSGEKGEKAEGAIGDLESAFDSITDAISNLETAQD